MINPFGSMRPEDEVYPSGMALSLSKIIDVTTFGAEWRQYVPFGLAEEGGPLSYRLGDVVEETFTPLLRYDKYLEQTEGNAAAVPILGSMCDFAFKTTSTVLGELTCSTSAAVLVVLVLLFRLVKSVLLPWFSSIGRRVGRASHGLEWEKKNEIRIVKFGEYVFRLLYHSSVSIYGVCYFWDKPWWDPSRGGTETLFFGHPNEQPIDPGMTWYYLVQSAYNIEALIELLRLSFDVRLQSPISTTKEGKKNIQSPICVGWSKTCRGDFREMFVHHIVTNLLIIGSSHWRFTRIGSMVFLVHDISDVPVDLSKLANFVKWKTTTIVCFVSMVLVWLVSRLIILPFVIYRAVLWESYILVSVGGLDPIYYYAYRPFFFGLIGVIILLHLVWFTMFIRMGWLLVSKGEAHDLSEHKKGEEQLQKQHHTNGKQKSS